MTKKTGFLISATYFIEIDKKDFGQQAAAYALVDGITKSGKLPADFSGTFIGASAKKGTHEFTDAPAEQTYQDDPAMTPLTTDAFPEGAVVIEQAEALDLSVIQTLRLADGTETMRRISREQADAESKPVTETKRGK